MPLFEYICSDCGVKYDILFKGTEKAEMIVCPTCSSKSYTKQLSRFAAAMSGSSSSDIPCADGGCGVPYSSPCANGMCGLG